jgi:hypothetical protein
VFSSRRSGSYLYFRLLILRTLYQRPNFTLKLVRPVFGPAAELPASSPARIRHGGCSSPLGSPNVIAATAALLRLRHAEPAAQLSVRSVSRSQCPGIVDEL